MRNFYKLFALLLMAMTSILSVENIQQVNASEITNYINNTSVIYGGKPLDSTTTNETVQPYRRFSITSSFDFPDEQTILSGDSLTLTIPKELRFYGAIPPFNVTNDGGDVVGVATVNASTQPNSVSVVFTDQFSKVPENKKMNLNFELVANENVLTTGEKVNTTIGGTPIAFTYQPGTGVGIDQNILKYSYKDNVDPDIIHWVAIVNAGQKPITNMVISDTLGQHQTFIDGSLKLDRLEIKADDPIDNETEAKSRTVIGNHASEVIFNSEKTQMTFTDSVGYISNINGKDYGNAYYIRYSSKIDRSTSGEMKSFDNTISVSGSNISTVSKNANYNDESGSGNASSSKSENVILKTKKNLIGKDAVLTENQFHFELYNKDDLSKPIQTKGNNADGTIIFDAIKYSQVGTYNYIIKEVIPAPEDREPGFTYDTNEVIVTVTVTKEANGVYMGATSYGSTTEFTNKYTSTISVKGTKIWVNDNKKNRPATLQVQLYANDVAVEGKITSINSDNTYSFENLPKYDENSDLIMYTVKEINVPKGYRVSYDPTGLNITNTYTPTSTQAKISVTKNLTGRELKSGEFEFTLSGEDGNKVETVKNGADGSVNFSSISYDKAGTYKYIIEETNTELSGITYDTTPITVTVTVIEDDEGKLEAKVTYENEDTSFENTYTPKMPSNHKPTKIVKSPYNRVVSKIKALLPSTGEKSTIILSLLGISILVFVIRRQRKNK
ncbi:Spy0128 family protein [Streptococcus parauberis]|uniref:Pilin isopeptide linkage domain protein n=1 Tax=Streptococcus parauberis NCFD 2020 TaxID=873447 RepID=F1Z0T3_9STRE|nr:FctA domain-containing protein [Streptococcus parauberis]EGE54725.1 pilin isopeptide linkage domain protein [Streptococcus parauberis NCFD 2020]